MIRNGKNPAKMDDLGVTLGNLHKLIYSNPESSLEVNFQIIAAKILQPFLPVSIHLLKAPQSTSNSTLDMKYDKLADTFAMMISDSNFSRGCF